MLLGQCAKADSLRAEWTLVLQRSSYFRYTKYGRSSLRPKTPISEELREQKQLTIAKLMLDSQSHHQLY